MRGRCCGLGFPWILVFPQARLWHMRGRCCGLGFPWILVFQRRLSRFPNTSAALSLAQLVFAATAATPPCCPLPLLMGPLSMGAVVRSREIDSFIAHDVSIHGKRVGIVHTDIGESSGLKAKSAVKKSITTPLFYTIHCLRWSSPFPCSAFRALLPPEPMGDYRSRSSWCDTVLRVRLRYRPCNSLEYSPLSPLPVNHPSHQQIKKIFANTMLS